MNRRSLLRPDNVVVERVYTSLYVDAEGFHIRAFSDTLTTGKNSSQGFVRKAPAPGHSTPRLRSSGRCLHRPSMA